MRKFLFLILALIFNCSLGFCQDKVDFSSYIDGVQEKIKNNWKPDFEMPKEPVEVTIFILKDGSLKSVNLKKSSGSKKTDDSAIKAINLSSPFEPLPLEYEFPELEVDLKLQTKIVEQFYFKKYSKNSPEENY